MSSINDPPNQRSVARKTASNKSVIESLVSGSLSSTLTTIVYQPLDLLKTRIQLQDNSTRTHLGKVVYFGKIKKSALEIIRNQGFLSLWKGTGASVIRSGPGVGLYYSLLRILQTNYSDQNCRPDDATQAFYFGIIARASVSFILLPVTVVKVRYESGRFNHESLIKSISSAYISSTGWVGLVPTVLRDSLFSGTYYMCYTHLKSKHGTASKSDKFRHHLRLFACGLVSGLVASFLTNPFDVLKTAIQATGNSNIDKRKLTMRSVALRMINEPRGFLRFFDGLVPRCARRTLIAASTWTFYELVTDLIHN